MQPPLPPFAGTPCAGEAPSARLSKNSAGTGAHYQQRRLTAPHKAPEHNTV